MDSTSTPRVLAGRYEVGELIGRGGMAEVHIGHDTRLGRTVAIKVLRSDLARDPSFLARFRREAQAAAALNHPAIVAVYDTGEDVHTDPTGAAVHVPFIVMEYVEGHTVRDILSDGAAVPIEEAIEITVGVLSALEYSHHAGIVHRDIKPANVMITPTGAVKVMDFGIARAVADSAATMTQTHAVIGTAQYLSPEQARGEQVDARSDLYSTGCLLFELLTGRPPFVGDSPVAVAYQHVGQAPQRPSELASDVPEVLDRITLKALTKDRDQRYSTAAEFRSDLESAARGGNVTAPMIGAAAAGAAAGYAATQVLGAGPGATQVMSPQSTAGPWGATSVQQAAAPVGPREEPEEEQRSRKGLMWTLIAIGALALAAIIAFLLLRPDGTAMATVPELPATVTPSEAQQIIEDAGFVYVQEEDAESEEPEGTFTRQDPEGGTSAPEGSEVHVWFSTGPDSFAMPDVVGMDVDEAEDTIEAAGLVVGEVEEQNHASAPEDQVISSDPEAGASVSEGDTVNLVVSTGQVELPNLVGRTQEEAEATLAELRLTAVIETEESDEEPGTVIKQSPEAGPVNQGERVSLTVAREREVETVAVPDVVGMEAEQAEATINGWNLNPTARTAESDSVCQGRVIETNPPAGAEVEVGTTVTYTVSLGPGGADCNGGNGGNRGNGGNGGGDGDGDGDGEGDGGVTGSLLGGNG
ncbi:serine/threonine protein kinase with PASTA sensor(s) [Isoptericola variabilis 225]|uniref:non-specific serine/threonine protein kinase n=1 Tax=Isoptericola variabilis (strain 225) TaxID=743718 RepID=F6FQ84_ISOV2|nr:serine/threonine protein kinase with PASTA sensor(s) [Isoptericola variabilis 225]